MSDDLTPLFNPGPDQPSQDVRFRQGVIITFDQNTLENTVLVGGTTLVNLPLLGVGEVTTLAAGSVVGVMAVGDAAKTMFITGRIVIPDTDDATDAVSLLNSQIVSTEYIDPAEATASVTYTDLATPGPSVTVNVGPTGRLLVLMSAQMFANIGASAGPAAQGRATVALSGANTAAAGDTGPLLDFGHLSLAISAGTLAFIKGDTYTSQAVFENLNPGLTTLTMKYRSNIGTSIEYSRRVLTVIKL